MIIAICVSPLPRATARAWCVSDADVSCVSGKAVNAEIEYMQMAAMQSHGGGSPRADDKGMYGVLRDATLRPSLRVTIACAMAQQFSGINNAFNFSSTFLSANGIG